MLGLQLRALGRLVVEVRFRAAPIRPKTVTDKNGACLGRDPCQSIDWPSSSI